MKTAISYLIALVTICSVFAGCGTTRGVISDFNAVVDTGKGVLGVGYDPTNGTTIEAVIPAKVYTLEK